MTSRFGWTSAERDLGGRSSVLAVADFPRYLWERSGTRNLLLKPAFNPDSANVERIVEWVRTWPATPSLSICIPTRDRLDLLVPCLNSLARTCSGEPVEVVIGDTGSAAETIAAYTSMGLKAISVPGAFNFSRACNAMAHAASGDVLLFLNSDIEATTPNWVQRLLQDLDGAIAGATPIVGATLVYPGTRRIQSAGIEAVRSRPWPQPNVYRPRLQPRASRRWGLQNMDLGRRIESLPIDPATVMAVTGAFLATTRRQFSAFGSFDEAFRVDLQDVDFCLRARAQGAEVVCRRDFVFVHKHAGTRGRYPFPLDDWNLFLGRWGDELHRWAR